MRTGRPTDYTPELGEQILNLMAEGLSLAAAAGECNVHRQRVYDWEARHPEFQDSIRLARSKRQSFLERRLLAATEGPVVTSSIFALKNAGQGDWRDKHEVDNTSSDGSMTPRVFDASKLSTEALKEIAGLAPDAG